MMRITGQGVNLRLTEKGVKCALWVRVDIGKSTPETKKSPCRKGRAKNTKNRAKRVVFWNGICYT